MEPNNSKFEGRLAGGLIAAAALGAMSLMLHHPTGHGEDGHLLSDWSSSTVHGAIMACLFVLLFAFSIMSRRLGEAYLSVRAAQMAFGGAIIAMTGAAVIDGFIIADLMETGGADAVALVRFSFMANQALAKLSVLLAGLAMALWAVRFARRDIVSKIAGGLGVALALAAVWWLLVLKGGLAMHQMALALLLFVIWCLIVAAQLIRGKL